MKQPEKQAVFVFCLRSEGADGLEPRKVYQVLPDAVAARRGHMRVIDESAEDYLYPAEYFAPLKLAAAAERELSVAV